MRRLAFRLFCPFCLLKNPERKLDLLTNPPQVHERPLETGVTSQESSGVTRHLPLATGHLPLATPPDTRHPTLAT